MPEDLLNVAKDPFVEGQHPCLVDLEIGNHVAPAVFPGRLTGQNQVGVVQEQSAREEDEQAHQEDETDPDALHMVHVLLALGELHSAVVAAQNLKRVSCGRVPYNAEAEEKVVSLAEEEEPELAVVELPDATADPEAMVVILADAALALLAMLAPVGLLLAAVFAEPLLRQLNLGYVLNGSNDRDCNVGISEGLSALCDPDLSVVIARLVQYFI